MVFTLLGVRTEDKHREHYILIIPMEKLKYNILSTNIILCSTYYFRFHLLRALKLSEIGIYNLNISHYNNHMKGALMQLSAFGAEDILLMGDPMITFFKKTYFIYLKKKN